MAYLRLRQICLVARALEPAVADLADIFGLTACYRDGNVGKYGLVNALLPIGASFLEVVARPSRTARPPAAISNGAAATAATWSSSTATTSSAAAGAWTRSAC